VLGVAEVAARALRSSRGAGKEADEQSLYTSYDPLLGWSKRPGARAAYRRREYTVEVAINGRGLRDPARPYHAPVGTVRLLALGDSFLEGYTVPLPQTATQVLEAELRAEGCRAEVLNGATAAYSTDQEYLFFRSEGARYRPRVVVLFFYYNDLVYNDRQDYFGLPKPALTMVGSSVKLHRYPVRRRAGAPAAPADREEPEGGGSALRELVRERLWHGAPWLHDALARLGLWPSMPRLPVRLELRVFERRRIPQIEQAWAKTGALLLALQAAAEAEGARLLVAYVPSRMEVDERTWTLSRRLYGMDAAKWDRRAVARRLAVLGRQAGFPVADLTAALRRADEPAYFVYDGHWTAAGHRAAARAVRQRLRELRWLQECGG
jgi:hypothetical protein